MAERAVERTPSAHDELEDPYYPRATSGSDVPVGKEAIQAALVQNRVKFALSRSVPDDAFPGMEDELRLGVGLEIPKKDDENVITLKKRR